MFFHCHYVGYFSFILNIQPNIQSLKSIKFSPRYLLLGISFSKSIPSLKLCLISEQTCKRREFHVNFFFYLDFLSRIFTNHRSAGEGGRHFFNYSLPLPPASQTLRHKPGDYCRELTSSHSQQPDSNREPLIFERKPLITNHQKINTTHQKIDTTSNSNTTH